MVARVPKGFALLEILIVAAIIMILIGGYGHFGGFGESSSAGTAATILDNTNATACQMSRQSVAGNIEMWQASSPGVPITPETLAEAQISMRCPHSRTGGTYVIVDGEIHCTDHYPPPAASPAYAPLPPPHERLNQGPPASSGASPQAAPTQGNPVWDAMGRRPAMP